MAYTTINNGKIYFNSVLYTGNGGTQSITGVGFQPDWVWVKGRSVAAGSNLSDAVRGVNKQLQSASNAAEETLTTCVTAFGSDGFSLGSNGNVNTGSGTFVSWNWLAAGTAPSNTYAVKVVSDGGNKYRFDDFGTSAVTLELSEGGTFTFDQSDSSNSNHPLRFSTTSNGTHGGGSEYTTGVTTNGTPGNAGAYTRITVAASAPTLYYYCTQHSGMGGQANTPVTNSFSNFSGSIQSNISPNTTSGFSIVSYIGTGSAGATVGHGLGTTPDMFIVKNRSASGNWAVYNKNAFTSQADPGVLYLEQTTAKNDSDTNVWGNSSVTINSTVFSLGDYTGTNGSGNNLIAYCFNEVKGYSKFGSYVGNGNADGTFVYTGFKPAWVMVKRSSGTDNWMITDNKRSSSDGNNVIDRRILPNLTNAEYTNTTPLDLLSNGFKHRDGDDINNASGSTYIYMAFAENPFTSSAGTPVTAR